MSKYTECPACNSGWEISPDENFCGFCGKKKIQYSFKRVGEDDELIYFKTGVEYQMTLVIENTGLQQIKINQIRVRESS